MTRYMLSTVLAAVSAGVCCLSPAAAQTSIIIVADQRELADKFCKADSTAEHVLVLPAALFVDSEELICPSGPYKLYRILEHNDPDDFDYYVDPPFGTRRGWPATAGRARR